MGRCRGSGLGTLRSKRRRQGMVLSIGFRNSPSGCPSRSTARGPVRHTGPRALREYSVVKRSAAGTSGCRTKCLLSSVKCSAPTRPPQAEPEPRARPERCRVLAVLRERPPNWSCASCRSDRGNDDTRNTTAHRGWGDTVSWLVGHTRMSCACAAWDTVFVVAGRSRAIGQTEATTTVA